MHYMEIDSLALMYPNVHMFCTDGNVYITHSYIQKPATSEASDGQMYYFYACQVICNNWILGVVNP